MPNWVDLPDLPTSGAQTTYAPNPFAGEAQQSVAPQPAPQYAPQPAQASPFSVVPIQGAPIGASRPSQTQARPPTEQNWVDIPWGAPAQPERPGYIGELDRAVSRGVVNQIIMPASEAALWAAQQAGVNVDPAREGLRQYNETFQQRYAPSVPSVTDIHGVGDAARYGISALGELVPFVLGAGGAARVGAAIAPRLVGAGAGLAEGASAAEIAAAAQAARTGAQAGVYGYGAAQGGLQGTVEAAKQYDDPGAAAVGGALGAAAGLVPGHIMMGPAGTPIARRVLQGAGTMGGVGVAGTVAHPLAGVAAGQEYVPPDAAAVADAFLQGAIGGGALGLVAGRVPRGTSTVETPDAGINAATRAALNDQLKGPPPEPAAPRGWPPPSQYALPGFDVAPVSSETPAGARGLYGPEPAGVPGGRPVPVEPRPAWDQRGPPPEINPAQPRIPGFEPASPEATQEWLRTQQTSPNAPAFNVGGMQVPGDAPLFGAEWRFREPGALPGPPPPDTSLPRGVVRPPDAESGFRAERRALPLATDAQPRPAPQHPPGSSAEAMQNWLDQFPGERRQAGEFSVPAGAPFLETNDRLQSLRNTVGAQGDLTRPLDPNAGDRVPGWVTEQPARAPVPVETRMPAPAAASTLARAETRAPARSAPAETRSADTSTLSVRSEPRAAEPATAARTAAPENTIVDWFRQKTAEGPPVLFGKFQDEARRTVPELRQLDEETIRASRRVGDIYIRKQPGNLEQAEADAAKAAHRFYERSMELYNEVKREAAARPAPARRSETTTVVTHEPEPAAALMTQPVVSEPASMPRTRGEQLREKQRRRMAGITPEVTPAQPVTTATVKTGLRRPGRDRLPERAAERVAERDTELARYRVKVTAREDMRARIAREAAEDLGQTADPEEARTSLARERAARNERAALAEDMVLREEAEPTVEHEPAREDRPGAIENVTRDVVRDMADAAPRERTGSNLDRKLADLEADIVSGRDPHDANRAYPENTHPRTRAENRTVAAWLDHRIGTLEEGPGNERAIAAMAESGTRIEADRKAGRSTKEQYEARSQDWRDQFDMISNPKYKNAEYVDKLKEARAALDKPEPPSPEREAEQRAAQEARTTKETTRRGALDELIAKKKAANEAKKTPDTGIHKMPAIFTKLFGSPDARLNHAVTNLLNKSGPDGANLHRYLDAVTNDRVLKARMPQFVTLARRLREIMPDDVRVYDIDNFNKKFGAEINKAEAEGIYWQGGHSIALDKNGNRSIVALMHETVHAATSRMVDHLPHDSRELRALREIQTEITKQFNERVIMHGDRAHEDALAYAISNPHETITMVMTDPRVHEFMAQLKPTAAFRERMAGLGYNKPMKSMWQSFVQWTRKLLGVPPEAESLLDHMMRPLSEIVERGAALNRHLAANPDIHDKASPWRHGTVRGATERPFADQPQALPKNPELRRNAEMAYHMSRSAAPDAAGRSPVQKAAEEALRVADPRGKLDLVRKGALQATGLDVMTRMYKDTIPALVEYGRKIQAENKITRELRDTLGDGAVKLLRQVPKAERNDLASLMNDATLHEVSVKPGADNTHVEDKAVVKDVQDRFAKLSDGAQKSYLDINNMYEKMYKGERDASLRSMIRTALPEGTQAQREEAFKAISRHTSPDRIKRDPELSELAKEFGETMKSKRSLLREVARIHAMGHVRGDYFPLARYGDYVVNYTTKSGDQGTEFFERHSDAQIRRKQLVEADMDPSPIMSKRASRLHAIVPAGMGDRILSALKDSDLTAAQKEQVQDAFSSTVLQYAARSDAVRNTMRRQGVEGASGDIERALSRRVNEHASRMGWLEHGTERMEMLTEMHRYVDALEKKGGEGKDLIAARAVIGELEKRAPLGDDASPGTLAHKLRQASAFGWVYSLMSPSQTVINTAEAHATALAHVGGRHGAGRTTLALGRALSQIAPVMARETASTLGRVHKGLQSADWNMSHYARDRLSAAEPKRKAEIDALFGAAEDAGLMGQTMSRDLLTTAMPDRTLTQGWWEKFLHYENVVAHAAEDMNRSAVLKAAYDLELKKNGGKREQAVEYGLDQLRKVFPNYNPGFRPRITTAQGSLGAFAAPVTQFKNYGLHTYGVLAETIQRSLKGMDAQDRHEARMALAYFVATRSLMAGALTWADDPIRWLGGAYDFLFTDNKRPHDYRLDLRNMMAQAMGPEAAEIAAKGVPHALGMDWSKSAGAGNMLNFPDMEDFSAGSFAKALGGIWFGAAGQDAIRMGEGMRRMFHGDFTGGLLDVLPVRMVRDVAKAHGLASEGVKDQSGQVILKPEHVGAGAVAAQALGFRPPAVTEFRERRAAIKQDLMEDRDERSGLMRRYAGASAGDRVEIMDDVREYNRANRTHPITRSQLLQAQHRQKQATKDVRTGGLDIPKARQREERAVGSFANVP